MRRDAAPCLPDRHGDVHAQHLWGRLHRRRAVPDPGRRLSNASRDLRLHGFRLPHRCHAVHQHAYRDLRRLPSSTVCQSMACQSAGADCTFIGCGHTLACTQGLLCRGAAQAAPAATVGGPAMRRARAACLPSRFVACTINTCGFACTAFVLCRRTWRPASLARPVNPTCAPFCTRACVPTPFRATPAPTPCANLTPCISIADPNCQTPFVPCFETALAGSTLASARTGLPPAHEPAFGSAAMGHARPAGFAAQAAGHSPLWAALLASLHPRSGWCAWPGVPGRHIM